MNTASKQVTQLLAEWRNGDSSARERLVPLVYAELHQLARNQMRQERPGHTLQPTALVHEAYLRLINVTQMPWQNRAHFYAISAQLMRRILVDFARRRNRHKRGGQAHCVSLSDGLDVPNPEIADMAALDEALTRLSEMDPRMGQVVELRFFGGLSVEETAEVLQISAATAMRDWKMAKVWLMRELTGGRHDK